MLDNSYENMSNVACFWAPIRQDKTTSYAGGK